LYVWKCECGQEFIEPGDKSGVHEMMAHYNQTKHRILGLFDADTGEKLVNGRAISAAQKLGYLLPSDKPKTPPKKGKAKGEEKEPSKGTNVTVVQQQAPAKAVIRPLITDLSPAILVLYEVARARYPQYLNASIQQFIEDCVVGFCSDHSDELGLDEILRQRPEFLAKEVAR